MVRRLIWGEDFGDSISPCSTMRPYGWDNGRHNGAWKATKVLPTVRMTAHARRWETAEINAELLDIHADPFDIEFYGLCGCYDCARLGVRENELEVYYDFADIPHIPRVTLFDAYKAKRK